MVVIVNVCVSDNSGELDLVQLFGLEEVHLFEFAHALDELWVLIKSVGFFFNGHDETPGGRCFLLVMVQGAAQES